MVAHFGADTLRAIANPIPAAGLEGVVQAY
jgi:hypothetical protein